MLLNRTSVVPGLTSTVLPSPKCRDEVTPICQEQLRKLWGSHSLHRLHRNGLINRVTELIARSTMMDLHPCFSRSQLPLFRQTRVSKLNNPTQTWHSTKTFSSNQFTSHRASPTSLQQCEQVPSTQRPERQMTHQIDLVSCRILSSASMDRVCPLARQIQRLEDHSGTIHSLIGKHQTGIEEMDRPCRLLGITCWVKQQRLLLLYRMRSICKMVAVRHQ